MDNFFNNKVIWITGASSGIGEALAVSFAGKGVRLILSARRIDELKRVAQICQEKGAETLIVPIDLFLIDSFTDKTKMVLAHFKQIDILIHNAGISCYGRVAKIPFGVEKQLFDINLLAPIALTKAVLPSMLARKTGQIIVIASALAYLEYPERAAYSACKHALIGYFHSLGFEVEADGLKVGVICPGFVATSLGKKALNEEGKPCNIDNPGQKKGMPATLCAQKIIKAIKKGKKEAFIGTYEPYAVILRRFFPSIYFALLSLIWRRWHKKIKKHI
ncbi:MAG: SDR family oxidoreductase [Proteobacteria bacterium]|nr:SDR family oxidoreductase [Pseudomonadota bacterium]